MEEGFREPGGGGGFFPIGGGGPFVDAEDMGLGASALAVFLRLANDGWKEDAPGRPGIDGAAAVGGRGADTVGGLGTLLEDTSGSDRYEESRFAITR